MVTTLQNKLPSVLQLKVVILTDGNREISDLETGIFCLNAYKTYRRFVINSQTLYRIIFNISIFRDLSSEYIDMRKSCSSKSIRAAKLMGVGGFGPPIPAVLDHWTTRPFNQAKICSAKNISSRHPFILIGINYSLHFLPSSVDFFSYVP